MLNEFNNKTNIISPNEYSKFHALGADLDARGLAEEKMSDGGRRKRTLNEAIEVKTLLTNQILIALPNNDFARLLSHLEPVSLQFGESLDKSIDKSRFVYFPESAVVSQLNSLSNGSTAEVAMVGYEGSVGLSSVFGFQPPTCWMEVTIAGSALRIDAQVFKQEFGRSAALQKALLGYINFYITQIAQKAVCNVHHLAEERLCTWLLMLHDRAQTDSLLLTQDHISRYLGVHRPSVTHVAQALREKAAISYVRGYLNILDRSKLESLACECYAAMRESVLIS